jgi:hypothetical protein
VFLISGAKTVLMEHEVAHIRRRSSPFYSIIFQLIKQKALSNERPLHNHSDQATNNTPAAEPKPDVSISITIIVIVIPDDGGYYIPHARNIKLLH